MHDLDILAIHMALNDFQEAKLKKQIVQNSTYVSIKCGRLTSDSNPCKFTDIILFLDFDSSMIIRGSLV